MLQRKKSEWQNSGRQAKHVRLYSGLLYAKKREPLITFGFPVERTLTSSVLLHPITGAGKTGSHRNKKEHVFNHPSRLKVLSVNKNQDEQELILCEVSKAGGFPL